MLKKVTGGIHKEGVFALCENLAENVPMHWVAETGSQLQRMGGTKPQIKQFRAETEERDAEEDNKRQADYNEETSDYQQEMEG